MKKRKIGLFKTFLPVTRHSTNFYFKSLLLLILLVINYLFSSFYTENMVVLSKIIVWYLIINMVFNYFKSVMIKLYLRKHNFDLGFKDNFTVSIKRISFALNHIIFFFVLLSILGIRLMDIITGISLFAVAITLIFKDYVSNFINGLIVMFSKDVLVNDYIKIGDFKGRIKDISFLTVELHSDNGDVVFVPNSHFISKEVINLSRNKQKKLKVEFTLPLIKKTKLEKFEKELKTKLTKKFKNKILDVNLGFSKYSKDSIDLYVETNLQKYNYELELEIKKEIFNQVSSLK